MIDRRLVQHFDWVLLVGLVLLIMVGLTTLYSATSVGKVGVVSNIFYKQLSWYGVGWIVLIVVLFFDYRKSESYAYWLYVGIVLMLVGVLIAGRHVAGARRWLGLGPIAFQPSEMMKIVIILALSKFYSKRVSIHGLGIRDIWPAILMTAIPFGLILKQPDLGTGLILVLIASSMTLLARVKKGVLLALCLTGLVVLPAGWLVLKEYQRQRIVTFLSPERDPLGAGYHIIQSKIAVGSGQLVGKGFMKGTQNVLSFLPEQHTDFIFSVLAEDWGLIGSFIVLLLFLSVIVWSLNIGHQCRDAYGIFVIYGISSLFFWEVSINVAMVMGMVPVVGIPLPFVSYGGTAVLVMMTSMGLLMNISMRRFLFE
ncbi:rod shape-determining protein RodA [Desulfatirhabdium butyrativorans]|uniref:rod shape-determining protein RodA n=1 Tax=Desulfatirhabdium butyrativorans TaxID=340467 RepID=UPI0004154190|nr:rod shape-determining protein RodA [Desulfatirhabdium butyrativorans]